MPPAAAGGPAVGYVMPCPVRTFHSKSSPGTFCQVLGNGQGSVQAVGQMPIALKSSTITAGQTVKKVAGAEKPLHKPGAQRWRTKTS